MDKFDWFKNEFNVLSASEQIDIYNRYCDINGRDGQIFPMSDINEFFVGCTPLDILVKAFKYVIWAIISLNTFKAHIEELRYFSLRYSS